MLGVTMDLSDKDMKFVRVRNKETRIKEMATSLGGIISADVVRPSEMPTPILRNTDSW